MAFILPFIFLLTVQLSFVNQTIAQSFFIVEPTKLQTSERALALSREVKEFLRDRYGLNPTSNNSQWEKPEDKELYAHITSVPPFTIYRHYGLAEIYQIICGKGESSESCQKNAENSELINIIKNRGDIFHLRAEPQGGSTRFQLSTVDIDRDVYELINRFLIHEDLHLHLKLPYGTEESFVMFLSQIFTYEFCSSKKWAMCRDSALGDLTTLHEWGVYWRALYTAVRFYWRLPITEEAKRSIMINEAHATDWSSYIFYIPALFRMWGELGSDNRAIFSFVKRLEELTEEEIAKRLNVNLE